jgi:hypothetical protein
MANLPHHIDATAYANKRAVGTNAQPAFAATKIPPKVPTAIPPDAIEANQKTLTGENNRRSAGLSTRSVIGDLYGFWSLIARPHPALHPGCTS